MFNFKKKFGQNFLVNNNIIKKICNSIPSEYENIYEIGCGTGNLTKELIKKHKVIGIEIDKDCIEELKKINNENLTLVNQDVMQYSFNFNCVVGNLPYNISSKILCNFVKKPIPFGIFMVQKEMAERILLKDFSKIGCYIQSRYYVEKICLVSAENFHPKPKVESAIIALKLKQTDNFNFDKWNDFLDIVFLHRRKMLVFIKKYENVYDLFNKSKIDLTKRIDQFTLQELLTIFNK